MKFERRGERLFMRIYVRNPRGGERANKHLIHQQIAVKASKLSYMYATTMYMYVDTLVEVNSSRNVSKQVAICSPICDIQFTFVYYHNIIMCI